MSALVLERDAPQTKSRPSVCLNMVTNGTMLDEYREVQAKKQALVAQFQILNTIEAELLLHLQVGGIL